MLIGHNGTELKQRLFVCISVSVSYTDLAAIYFEGLEMLLQSQLGLLENINLTSHKNH